MGKLIKLKVLIVGMRGLGIECAKNLILAGPASVAIYDPTTVSINDLGANFYLKEAHVNNVSRTAGSLEQLSELNPFVKVSVVNELLVDDHAKYNVVCYTENFKGISHLMDVNRFCSANKIGLILSETLGAANYAFLDFGD
jgi:ubiquitin-activating enzyme E1